MNTIFTPTRQKEKQWLLLFMLCWFVINALQAIFLGLDGDEAYYWVLAQNPDWSYFDHPPVAPLLISWGEHLGHGTFFTRLGTIVVSTCTIPVIYAALPAHLKNIRWFVCIYAATLIFNVYAFITTPDAPLLFFSALFFYGYKKFLHRQSLPTTLLMALAVTGMFYSKYHGILPVAFVVLSNIRLLASKYFWVMVLVVSLLFLPHLYWQYQHHWPTVTYHLIERLSKTYQFNFTSDYLLGQLLIWGPLISVFYFIHIYKLTVTDQLIKAHLFNFAGVLLFFVISSFKNTVEPHWTLIAGVSFLTLFLQLVANGSNKFRSILLKLCYVNMGLILIARLLFLLPASPFRAIKHYSSFFEGKKWAAQVYAQAKGLPVIFLNSYAMPALYQFYHTDAAAYGYSTKAYRKTNYTLQQQDRQYDGKAVVLFSEGALPHTDTSIMLPSNYRNGYITPITAYQYIGSLKITVKQPPQKFTPGETKNVLIEINNTGTDTIFNAKKIMLDYAFFIAKFNFINAEKKFEMPDNTIAPGYTKQIPIAVTAPEKPGRYKLLFSYTNGVIPGNFASDFYPVQVR